MDSAGFAPAASSLRTRRSTPGLRAPLITQRRLEIKIINKSSFVYIGTDGSMRNVRRASGIRRVRTSNRINDNSGRNTDKLKKLIDKIAKDTKPTDGEIADTIAYSNSIMNRLKERLKSSVEIILAGSVARGTQIRGKSDIDIFLMFPKTLDEREMEHKAIEIAKSIVDSKRESFVINYAEHPYIKIIDRHTLMSADIVPAFKIRDASEMASAVDRTPLHNLFVNSNLTERQKGDVRVLKYFLDQHYIYGAEARVGGFSGYLCEILVYSYGSFLNLISNFANAQERIVVDVINRKISFDKGDLDSYCKRFGSNFVVIDPTDNNRNVAAAVSQNSLARFVMISRRLLKDDPKRAFYREKFSESNNGSDIVRIARDYSLDMYSIVMESDRISEDTVWPQLVKLSSKISTLMIDNKFEPLLVLYGIRDGKAVINIMANALQNGAVVINGPSVFFADGAEKFYLKHKKRAEIFIERDRLIALEKSRFRDLKELLNFVVRDKSFKFPSHIKKSGARVSKRLSIDEDSIIFDNLVRKRI